MVQQAFCSQCNLVGSQMHNEWFGSGKGALRLCVHMKAYIKGKVLDEDYPMPDMEIIIHNHHRASCFGKNNLSDAYYQIELDEDAKNIHNQHIAMRVQDSQASSGLEEFFIHLPVIGSTLEGIKGVIFFRDDVLVYGTKEQ